MISGKWIANAVSTAAELGIADLLAGGAKSIEDLAAQSRTHPPSLYRLLRALAAVGVFAETGGQRFELTPLAECLRSDSPDSVRAFARFAGAPFTAKPWCELLHCVRTGETAVKKVYGLDNGFDYFKDHPAESEIFNQAMTSISRKSAPVLVQAYDFGRFRQVVDVAGGHGVLLLTILKQYPSVRGVIFDLPHVVAGANEAIAAAGLTRRCNAEGGDFFRSVTPGADAYILKHIIHDWDDERSRIILENCRRAMAPGGRVLVMESVIAPGNDFSLGKLLDLEMMVLPGGKERTEEEYRALFASAGLRLAGLTPTDGLESIIEAVAE
jgi:SAM-dependent methyltransferase